MALLKLHGHYHFLEVDQIEVIPVKPGRWTIRFDGREFTVIGGRKAGGAHNEWYCHEPRLYGEEWMPAKTMIAAIKLGAQY